MRTAGMNKFLGILFILLTAAGNIARADVAVGGQCSFRYNLLIDPQDPLKSTPALISRFDPIFELWSDFFVFSCSGSLSYAGSNNTLDVFLKDSKVSFYPIDPMSISLGRFHYLPGTAEFFSHTNYFARSDYEIMLSQGGGLIQLPCDLAQIGFYFFDFYLLITVSPFWQPMILPEITSPWFPRNGLPKSITVSLPFERIINIGKLLYIESQTPDYDLSQVSMAVEVGGTILGVDFGLLYYQGWDNTPLLTAAFDLSNFLTSETFDILLTPYYRKIKAIGLILETNIGALRLWSDASFTIDKSFLTNELSATLLNTVVSKVPFLEYTLGMSYDFPFLGLIALAEFRNSHIIEDSVTSTLIEPFLHFVGVGTLLMRVLDYRLQPSFSVLFSFEDYSVSLISRCSYTPSDEFSLSVLLPLFFGELDSELGQYQENYTLTLIVDWRF